MEGGMLPLRFSLLLPYKVLIFNNGSNLMATKARIKCGVFALVSYLSFLALKITN
jgi:hypothetical protein